MMANTLPRGIRLKNPGNIRISPTQWQGKLEPSQDSDFETFKSPIYGIRAIAKILLTDAHKGINTVSSIINKYAPSTENNTTAYIAAVADHLGVEPDTVINLDDYRTMYTLVTAIIMHENGMVPYTEDLIKQALEMAGVYNVPPVPLAKQPETHVATGATVIATVSAVGTAVQAVAPAFPFLQQVITVAPWVVTVLALAGAGYMAYLLYRKHKTGV